eukprot:CAMPEP_0118964342 /NCGR_PEP_ID=MMETSP1173-20130426/2059_1 /TAXON_ID=1034831 /ORGANISM="Rhizochromulina marina cf, Strain CCMP1243" /LENGTH=141 /DNA_ID=CAMNT_0006912789 /DNA_START=1 /DNA_END=427 /DNA_ORIENTATION=+
MSEEQREKKRECDRKRRAAMGEAVSPAAWLPMASPPPSLAGPAAFPREPSAALTAHSTSEEQREKKRVRQRRSAMSEEQREKKNAYLREYRAAMSEEQREKRRENKRKRYAAMSKEQREKWREKNREHCKKYRAAMSLRAK